MDDSTAAPLTKEFMERLRWYCGCTALLTVEVFYCPEKEQHGITFRHLGKSNTLFDKSGVTNDPVAATKAALMQIERNFFKNECGWRMNTNVVWEKE